MNTITKYVLAETVKAFLVAVVVTTALTTLGGGFKEGISKGLPPWLVLQIFPYLLPETLRFTLPGCLLFAVCTVFARMSAFNEIVALKSLGISPLRIVTPVLLLSVVLSLGTFWLYDLCATWGRPGLARAVVQSLADVAYGVLRSEGAFISDKFSIVVSGVRDDVLIAPVIMLPADGDRAAISLTAQEGRLVTDAHDQSVRILVHDGELEVGSRGKLSFPDTIELGVALGRKGANDPTQLSPAALGMTSIPAQIDYERAEIARLEGELAGEDADSTTALAETKVLDRHKFRCRRLQAEPHRRVANGFSCLSFALLGIPVAMWWRFGDALSVFFVCFLPILLLYYPLLVLGEQFSNSGAFPSYGVWLANAVLLAAGLIMLRRVVRR